MSIFFVRTVAFSHFIKVHAALSRNAIATVCFRTTQVQPYARSMTNDLRQGSVFLQQLTNVYGLLRYDTM